MNTAKKFWNNAKKSSSLAYNTLYELTLEASGLSKYPQNLFNPKVNCWDALVDAWNNLFSEGAYLIFLDAIHRIMWGTPYCWANPKYDEIVRIVEHELLLDRDAFNYWHDCGEFADAIYTPTKSGTAWLANLPLYQCSERHYEYLATKMLYKVIYTKRKYRKERRGCEIALNEYPSALEKIIPDIRTWDEARFVDEGNILDEIKRLYGVDYNTDPDTYANLISMLACQHTYNVQKLFTDAMHSMSIKTLPRTMVDVIWPINTNDAIESMFRVSVEFAADNEAGRTMHDSYKAFTYKAIRESWLYEAVKTPVMADETGRELKKAFFDVTMRT